MRIKKENSIELKAKFIELRGIEGMSFESIAKKINVSKTTLIKWNDELKEEIKPLIKVRLKSLSEKYLFSKEKKVEIMGKLHKKVVTEIMKRDLNDVQTDKLFRILIDIQNTLPLDSKSEENKKDDNPLGPKTIEVQFIKPNHENF